MTVLLRRFNITIAAILFTLMSLLLLTSCSTVTNENVDIRTTLTIDSSFSGSRTVVLTFPESVIPQGSEKESNLDKIVQKYCPGEMNSAKNTSGGKISYSFILKFESKSNYEEKASAVIGSPVIVSFSNPDTVMTKGWKLEESFVSYDLMGWIQDGAKAEGFENFDFTTEETFTQVSLNDDIQNSKPQIYVNTLDGYPIQKITINTVNQKTSYDRTVVFTISQTTFDSLADKIKQYFAQNTDKRAASAEWLLENNSYNYTVKFNDASLQEITGYTNKLLDSIYCESSYVDKSTGSTALAEQNSFTESLDASNFIGIGRESVPIEYTYSVDGSSELGECQIFRDGEWEPATDLLDTNRYGKTAAVRFSDSFFRLKINDGIQYTASSIEITATPRDNNTLEKSITFKYDIATGGNEASDYTTSYFAKMNKGAVQSVDGVKNTCTVTFSGTPDEINTQISAIFGEKNLIKSANETQFMSLRTKKQFSDHIDFSSLITGKNVDTPIYYYVATQSGDIIKSFCYSYSDTEKDNNLVYEYDDLKKDENGSVSIRLATSDADVDFSITTPNISDIVFCSFISALIILITIALIFVFKSRKLPASALGAGSREQSLGSGASKLAVRDREKSPNKEEGNH